MIETIRETTTIQPGGRIELMHPEIPVGTPIEVVIRVERPRSPRTAIADLFGAGRGCFRSVDEVDEFVRKERENWSR